MNSSLQILYVGAISPGQTCHERMVALQNLGHRVEGINSAPPPRIWQKLLMRAAGILDVTPDMFDVNEAILNRLLNTRYDILWIDKGIAVRAKTLLKIKNLQPACHIVHLNPDDPFGRFHKGWKVFLKALPCYDIHFVARTPNIAEYQALGGKNIHVYDRSFATRLHRPVELTATEQKIYSTQVGFIGSCAPERSSHIAFLIQNGIPVAVYGDGWHQSKHWEVIKPHYRGAARYGEPYIRAINGMGIALHFLRHENRDEQDSRTFEIPACGVFMLAERSPKHEAFFREGEEAVFFDSREDLLEKVRYHLSNPAITKQIAAAGRRRCIQSGYDHQNRMKEMVKKVVLNRKEN